MARSIRTAAKALIIQDEKLAVIRIEDAGEAWYLLPGGGQEAEETLPQALEREVAEELGMRVRCGELLFVVEGVHGEDSTGWTWFSPAMCWARTPIRPAPSIRTNPARPGGYWPPEHAAAVPLQAAAADHAPQ